LTLQAAVEHGLWGHAVPVDLDGFVYSGVL
jgi:hypothetical protein